MIKARHVGLVVDDLDRSIKFYSAVFGLSVWKRAFEEDPSYISRLVGLENPKIEYAKMEISDSFILELLQYHNYAKKEREGNYDSNRHGCSHLALTVTDSHLIHGRILEGGGHCNSEPLISPDGNVRVFYAHDLDGIILEIVEELK